jgi:hypothetical protein
MKTMKENLPKLNSRVKEIIDALDNGKVVKFSKRLENVSQQRLNRIFNTDTRTKKYPSVPDDVLVDIATSVPEINLDWLLAERGAMFKNNQQMENMNKSIAIGRDANGNEIHITSQNIDEFVKIIGKYQEQTDRMLSIIEKLTNK